MDFVYSSGFSKKYKKLIAKDKSKVEERLRLFAEDEFHPLLSNHKLHGEYANCRSINITGDIRIVYEKLSTQKYYLRAIGTHSELYE